MGAHILVTDPERSLHQSLLNMKKLKDQLKSILYGFLWRNKTDIPDDENIEKTVEELLKLIRGGEPN